MSQSKEKIFNKENFLDSLEKRCRPEKEIKDIIIGDKVIKNVPVIKDNREFENFVTSDILTQIYKLIESNSEDQIIDFKQ